MIEIIFYLYQISLKFDSDHDPILIKYFSRMEFINEV